MFAQIFGREAELRTISAFLDGVPRSPGALVLAGSAGAGKTTLLRAGTALARDRGFTVLRTTPAQSDLRLAFAGLADLLGAYLDTVIDELPAPQARALRQALMLQEVPAHPPEPRVIAAALRTVLVLLARSAPVLLVIDDVQWLDPPTEAAASFAIRRLDTEAVGLLCAMRPTGGGENLPLELDRGRLATEPLPVGGMSIGALYRLLRARLDTSFSHPTLRRIEAESGGNPFIALEIGRTLARSGITSVGSSALPVPRTLISMVGERLGELPPEVHEALHLVAVMPAAPLEHYLAAGLSDAQLDVAVVAGVLDTDGRRLQFSHPLLASAVTASIPPGRLRTLHGIAARHVQRPEERARHRALAATGSSSLVAAELEEAAEAAVARGAPATAAELYNLAASLTPLDQPADAGQRVLRAASQLGAAGETRAATAALEKLIASTPPGPQRAAALSQLASLRQDQDGAAATSLLEQALAEAGNDPAHTAGIHLTLAENWTKRGDEARSLAESRHALADAERAGDPVLLARSMAFFVRATVTSGGGFDEPLLERALELERVVGGGIFLRGTGSPSWMAGWCHLAEGRLDEAESEMRRVLAWCHAEGVENWRADVLLRLSVIAACRGDSHLAAELAAEGLEIAEQVDLPQLVSALLYACGDAALQLGQVAAVRDFARRGIDAAREAGELPYLLRNEALLGSLDLALGDYRNAAARLRPLAARWREMGVRLLNSRSIEPEAVEAIIALGELDEAGQLLAEMERDVRNPMSAGLAAHSRAKLAAARLPPVTWEQIINGSGPVTLK